MSEGRSGHSDNLLLIAATMMLVLATQRYFQANPRFEPVSADAGASVAQPVGLAHELAQHGHGRRSRNPFQIPFAGWKDIL